MGVSGEQESSPDWRSNGQSIVHGSVQVERRFSKTGEWVSRGAIAPDLPERIDGCRESEVSRECLTGDTVYWLCNGFNTLEEP